jgi:hypothetical protein
MLVALGPRFREDERMGYPFAMTNGDGKKRGERGAARRAERSRQALRENLKRRKAQARARQQESGPSGNSAGIAPEKPKV